MASFEAQEYAFSSVDGLIEKYQLSHGGKRPLGVRMNRENFEALKEYLKRVSGVVSGDMFRENVHLIADKNFEHDQFEIIENEDELF